MKRKLVDIIIALITVIALAAAVGCTPKVEQYGVSVSYDETFGTVTVVGEKGATAEKFDAGSTVTITATPKDGYALTNVIINNEEAAIVGMSHTFTIVAETTIVVTFEVAQGTGG